MKRYDLNASTGTFLVALMLFFGIFLFYPVGHMLKGAFGARGEFTFKYFGLILASPLQRESIFNSFLLATITTLLTTLLTLPLAHLMTRFDFRGKGLLGGLLLVPMIMPPFVGAIGLKQMLAKFGSVNLLLTDLGVIAPDHPIDWLGGGGSPPQIGQGPQEIVGRRAAGVDVAEPAVRPRVGVRALRQEIDEKQAVNTQMLAPALKSKFKIPISEWNTIAKEYR